MDKYIRYPQEFDSLQFSKVLSKAEDVAYDIKKFHTTDDEWLRDKYFVWYKGDSEAFDFACELLGYDRKAIYDTIRILRRNVDVYDSDIFVYLNYL